MEIVSGKEAKERGLVYFFTGIPCKHGHTCTRYTIGGTCTECRRIYTVEYRKKYSEQLRKTKQEYQAKNKEAIAAKKRIYYQANKKRFAVKFKANHVKNRDRDIAHSKAYYNKNKERLAAQGREYREANKEKLLKRSQKYREKNREALNAKCRCRTSTPAPYDTYAHRLISYETKRTKKGLLKVRCRKCGKFFKPSVISVKSRLAVQDGKLGGRGHLYCSEKCKIKCDTYSMTSTPKSQRPKAKRARCQQVVHRRALLAHQIDECGYNYCEKCGNSFPLEPEELHHSVPISHDIKAADDVASFILLCNACHLEAGAECREDVQVQQSIPHITNSK